MSLITLVCLTNRASGGMEPGLTGGLPFHDKGSALGHIKAGDRQILEDTSAIPQSTGN